MDYHYMIEHYREIHSYIYMHGLTKAAKHYNISYTLLSKWKLITLPLLNYSLIPIDTPIDLKHTNIKTNDDDIRHSLDIIRNT